MLVVGGSEWLPFRFRLLWVIGRTVHPAQNVGFVAAQRLDHSGDGSVLADQFDLAVHHEKFNA